MEETQKPRMLGWSIVYIVLLLSLMAPLLNLVTFFFPAGAGPRAVCAIRDEVVLDSLFGQFGDRLRLGLISANRMDRSDARIGFSLLAASGYSDGQFV